MKILGIDHVAVCTSDLDGAASAWTKILGLGIGPRERVDTQKTEAAFLLTAAEADACIELIAPIVVDGAHNIGLEKFLAARNGKAGLHHVAFVVDDLAAALVELDQNGVPLIDKIPRPGARGHQVGFLHPSAADGVLIELVGHGPARKEPH
jgi:methylmalonyl-CoA epimerase